MEQKKNEFTNLLIRNLPKEREETVKTIIQTLSKSYNEEWVIDNAPIAMENLLKLLTVLEVKMKQVEKALIDLKTVGFNVSTENLENILRLREQFLDRVVSKLDKKIDVVYNAVLKPKYEPPKSKSVTKKKPKSKGTVTEFMGARGILIPKILRIICFNKSREFTSEQLAKRIYGKVNRENRRKITNKLKKHKDLINTRKEGKFMYYKWNPKAKKVM